jgi:hypothetical protein
MRQMNSRQEGSALRRLKVGLERSPEQILLDLAVTGFVINRDDLPIYRRRLRLAFMFEQAESAEDEAIIQRRDSWRRLPIRFVVEA